jgi:lipopolysaccharide/colanic/teichoic acid biosynthesis glycosyltransferase
MQWLVKQVFDRIAALVLLVLAAPIFVVAVVLIKLSSRGPVLFAQERIGWNERPFRILKFRTMHVHSNDQPLDSVTVRDDPRVFAVGRWLRKLKIDELPQIFNVLSGSMSLVGPRPTVIDDYRRMTPEQRRRAAVKPGMTGLAQVRGNTSLSWPQRIDYDLRYVDGQSLWLDGRIIFATIMLLLTFRAESHPQGDDEWTELPRHA